MGKAQTIDYKICEFERGFKKYLIEDINLVKFIKQGRLTFDEKLLFKHIASNIHNIITLSMTNALVDLLEGRHTPYPGNANSNGYDLVYPSQNHPTIIAEIKSTEPTNGKFYEQQSKELREDLKNLMEGKQDPYVPKDSNAFTDAIKVMILLDKEDVKTAYKQLVDKSRSKWLQTNRMNIEIVNDITNFTGRYNGNQLMPDRIYVVFVMPTR
ncbi:MAG: hypothetical protein IKQ09_00965 [Bacteroidales bacterium]|nr:hypothetical protein [Bacteroidales bacterium]